MKVLWITNLLPAVVESHFQNKEKINTVGGWLIGAASALRDVGVELTMIAPSSSVKKLSKVEIDGIVYYAFPLGKGNLRVNKEYNSYWPIVIDIVKPDVVHIHGTEFSHGLSFVKTCGSKNVVVSIQGLTSVYARYYLSGLSTKDIVSSITLRDIAKFDSLYQGKRDYERRGEFEIELLRNCKNVIGRTTWDYSHALAINDSIRYFKCNETLRTEFYEAPKWDYTKCLAHSIFVSQSYYPIKGFHILLRAIEIVKRHYPDVTIYVAGTNNLSGTLKNRLLHKTGYANFLSRLIREIGIEKNVIFTGPLDTKGMIEHYLKANVFVSASAIENSPNSLCEAQILGCPCISSFVGGVQDLIPNSSCGLTYQFEEHEILACHIQKVFSKSFFDNSEMVETAETRHDRVNNAKKTMEIYNAIRE